jgi:hypothetical protein
MSLVPDADFSTMCAEADDSDGQRGIFWGRLILSEHAYLSVFEFIEVRGSGVHRVRYSYYLVYDEAEVWGYDRDPDHEPSLHRHQGPSHARHPCRRYTFREIAEKAWQTTTAEEELRASTSTSN